MDFIKDRSFTYLQALCKLRTIRFQGKDRKELEELLEASLSKANSRQNLKASDYAAKEEELLGEYRQILSAYDIAKYDREAMVKDLKSLVKQTQNAEPEETDVNARQQPVDFETLLEDVRVTLNKLQTAELKSLKKEYKIKLKHIREESDGNMNAEETSLFVSDKEDQVNQAVSLEKKESSNDSASVSKNKAAEEVDIKTPVKAVEKFPYHPVDAKLKDIRNKAYIFIPWSVLPMGPENDGFLEKNLDGIFRKYKNINKAPKLVASIMNRGFILTLSPPMDRYIKKYAHILRKHLVVKDKILQMRRDGDVEGQRLS